MLPEHFFSKIDIIIIKVVMCTPSLWPL